MTEVPPDVEQLMIDHVDLLNVDDSKPDVLSESYRYRHSCSVNTASDIRRWVEVSNRPTVDPNSAILNQLSGA